LLSIDERLQGTKPKTLKVPVVANQTLAEFEDDVLNGHMINLSNYALILMGHEVKDDHAFLGDLGFVPECTIYAGIDIASFHCMPVDRLDVIISPVADVHICVTTSGRDFDMVLSPTTRISTIRQTLEGIDVGIRWHEFWFSLDGKDSLPETSTMWDLDILSNTMIVLSKSPADPNHIFNLTR
jgi:hypothetical protein